MSKNVNLITLLYYFHKSIFCFAVTLYFLATFDTNILKILRSIFNINFQFLLTYWGKQVIKILLSFNWKINIPKYAVN